MNPLTWIKQLVATKREGQLPLPPEEYIPGIGKGEFFRIGEEFVGLFSELGGLRASDCVLDVGCGLGRIAGPLTRFLKTGRYDGFDVVPEVVNWCEANLSPLHPRFRFRHADIANTSYNPSGNLSGDQFQFPYDDGSFDFVFLTSVFTHMLEAEVSHYIREISRVLRPSGRVFATFFIVDELSKTLIAENRTSVWLTQPLGVSWVSDLGDPHQAVGYNLGWIEREFGAAGLVIQQPVHFGNWCEREDTTSYQDIVIASRESIPR